MCQSKIPKLFYVAGILIVISGTLSAQLVRAQKPNVALNQTVEHTEVSAEKVLTPDEQFMVLNRAKQKNRLTQSKLIRSKYLGVSSEDDPKFADRKYHLWGSNPDSYRTMLDELKNLYGDERKILARHEYDALPEKRKASIGKQAQFYITKD